MGRLAQGIWCQVQCRAGRGVDVAEVRDPLKRRSTSPASYVCPKCLDTHGVNVYLRGTHTTCHPHSNYVSHALCHIHLGSHAFPLTPTSMRRFQDVLPVSCRRQGLCPLLFLLQCISLLSPPLSLSPKRRAFVG